MSDTTSDNDDLSLTHEYMIAGVVIFLFGLLYWFLNGHSEDDSISPLLSSAPATTLESTREKMPRQGHPLVPAAVATSAVAATTAATATTTAKEPLADSDLSISSEVEQSRQNNTPDTLAQDEKSVSPVAETDAPEKASLASKADESVAKTAETKVAPEQAAATVANETTNKANQAETTGVAKPDTGNAVADTAEEGKAASSSNEEVAPVYSLPDGTKIKLSANGFEGELQQLFQNGILNKPLTYDQVYFDTGSAKINDKSNRQIMVTAALMHAYPKINILLRGHTDNRGSATDNFQLSLARANSMGLALGALGIDTERIRVLGMGDSFPVASNNTEEGRKKNRRIEILLQ